MKLYSRKTDGKPTQTPCRREEDRSERPAVGREACREERASGRRSRRRKQNDKPDKAGRKGERGESVARNRVCVRSRESTERRGKSEKEVRRGRSGQDAGGHDEWNNRDRCVVDKRRCT